MEPRILAGPDGPRLVERPDGLVDLVGLDPRRLMSDARAAASVVTRPGRPPAAPGELTDAEIVEAIAIRRRRGLKVTVLEVAGDLGVAERTLWRAIADSGSNWQRLAQKPARRRST